jgi:uncharacterized protein with PIN domain
VGRGGFKKNNREEGGMKFLADRTLGKLVKGLRMLGYDTVYYRGEDLHRLFHLARQQGRVILTRSTKLFPKRPEDRIVFVKEDNPLFQLRGLIQSGLISTSDEELFSRCLLCNAVLESTPPKEVEGKVPDFVFYQRQEFFRCPECHRIYWPGSHQENMKRKVEELFRS